MLLHEYRDRTYPAGQAWKLSAKMLTARQGRGAASLQACMLHGGGRLVNTVETVTGTPGSQCLHFNTYVRAYSQQGFIHNLHSIGSITTLLALA